MLKAALLATLALVLGTIVLGLYRMFHLVSIHDDDNERRRPTAAASRHLRSWPLARQQLVIATATATDSTSLLLRNIAAMSLCDGSVYHCPLVHSCVASFSLDYLNYCTYKGERVQLAEGSSSMSSNSNDYQQATQRLVHAYKFTNNNSLLPLYVLDADSADFAGNLDRLTTNSSSKHRITVLSAGVNETNLRLARAHGRVIAVAMPAIALSVELVRLKLAVVHVYGQIARKLRVEDTKCIRSSSSDNKLHKQQQQCDLIDYAGHYIVLQPTDATQSLLASYSLARTTLLQRADPIELLLTMASKTTASSTPPLSVWRLPAPGRFAALGLCDGTGYYYGCSDNPTCDASDRCRHKHRDVELEDSQTWKSFWVQREQREQAWHDILQRMRAHTGANNANKRLLVMSFNIGFAHLFANWLCSIRANDMDVSIIQQHTLIVAQDQLAIDYVTQLGFFAPTLEEVERIRQWTDFEGGVEAKASSHFGTGAHKKINLMLKFSLPLDLLNLGYSVMVQDVDLVWTRNVFHLLFAPDGYCGEECDAVFLHEKRPFIAWDDAPRISWLRRRNETLARFFPTDDVSESDMEHKYEALYPEANTGLFMIKPRANVIALVEVLLEASRLQQWYSRDQILWNSMLYNAAAPKLNFTLLPPDLFVPGKFIRPSYIANGHAVMITAEGLAAVHASDTSNYKTKYHRLFDIGHWYLEGGKCGTPFWACEAIPACFAPFELSLAYCRKTDLKCLARLTPEERAAVLEL